jgi:hypothetical protein
MKSQGSHKSILLINIFPLARERNGRKGPDANTDIECGASVPLYGQSGGGVEIKFVKHTNNRCAIASPVVLPAL